MIFMEDTSITRLAFLGDYVPRRCGIATFTSDLCRSIAGVYRKCSFEVITVNDTEGGYAYPPEVRFEIPDQDVDSYHRAAEFVNINNIDVLCVQHEFGIYGGACGRNLLALLRDVRIPVVTTLHTILPDPSPDQRAVMDELANLSTLLVVMTNRSVDFLRDIYNVPNEKIMLIPHGIPDMPFVDPNYFKDDLGVLGKNVLLTFGLLSPNKGIEHVLHAMPKVVAKYPNTVYMIVGATHPHILREHGEEYRLSLERLAKSLKISKYVAFYNRFVDLDELRVFIGASDVYITPYLVKEQVVSGTLSYCFGAGKAVVSSPYWHAEELLAEGRGVLVPFKDGAAIGDAVVELFGNPGVCHTMRKNAYNFSREMVWNNVAHRYMKTFETARRHWGGHRIGLRVRTLDQESNSLPELKLDHLKRMTDSTGILQHAIFSVPNYDHGYCTDDNARALVLTVWLEELGVKNPDVSKLATTYAAFLFNAFNQKTGCFRNFMGYDRRWIEERGSEDCHGRAIWALGNCLGRSSKPSLEGMAGQLLEQALNNISEAASLRAGAFTLVGLNDYGRRFGGDRKANQLREMLTQRLVDAFLANSSEEWPWFENTLTYCNARLPHAILLSGRYFSSEKLIDIALKAMRWLLKIQTSDKGHFQPVGSNGFYPRGKTKAKYDQQPVEAQSTISACLEAFGITSDSFWLDEAYNIFDWFMGRNDLSAEVYNPRTGGCRDGLQMDRINNNEGAESTLAMLLSVAELEMLQHEVETTPALLFPRNKTRDR